MLSCDWVFLATHGYPGWVDRSKYKNPPQLGLTRGWGKTQKPAPWVGIEQHICECPTPILHQNHQKVPYSNLNNNTISLMRIQ